MTAHPNDLWHIGALPGDAPGVVIRDGSGLLVATAGGPEGATILVEEHNATAAGFTLVPRHRAPPPYAGEPAPHRRRARRRSQRRSGGAL